jgi:cell division protein ZapA
LELQKTDNYAKLSAEYKQILLGMNLADEFFREKKKNQILESEIERKDKELYSLKHELINLQLDLEKLQKEK